tara:strand:+ start:7853 stop:7993 length:141 start_codon:yes stop_codon:yes gene_type:complete
MQAIIRRMPELMRWWCAPMMVNICVSRTAKKQSAPLLAADGHWFAG